LAAFSISAATSFQCDRKTQNRDQWRKPAKFCLEVEQIHWIAFEAVAPPETRRAF
jgi:hypothetical protein